MDAIRVRTIRQRRAPATFPCPTCGTPGRRKDTHTRQVRDLAYGHIPFVELTVGEYRAAGDGCKTFRSHVDGIEPRAEYTHRVRQAVIDRLLDDGPSVNRLRRSMRRDFLLDLSAGFLSDGLDWKVRQTDRPAYRRWTRANFPGTLCVDERHLGHRVLAAGHRPARRLSRRLRRGVGERPGAHAPPLEPQPGAGRRGRTRGTPCGRTGT